MEAVDTTEAAALRPGDGEVDEEGPTLRAQPHGDVMPVMVMLLLMGSMPLALPKSSGGSAQLTVIRMGAMTQCLHLL